jgi:sulfoxide reductase heme-binding subunit YedZ
VLVTVPFFDANRYPPSGDIFTKGLSGALPDGDYPPTGPPSGTDGGHDPSTRGGTDDSVRTPSTTAPSGHNGPPAGGPGSGATPTTTAPETTTTSGAHTGPPAGGHPGGNTTGTDADGESGAAATISTDHAGDQDTVLRMRRLSTMTGYVALGLIALTMLIGPANLLRGRRLPVSSHLRRDVGIWAAAVSVTHVVLGFLVNHGDGELLSYFFEPGDRTDIMTNTFGLANWAGLLAVAIIAVLAAISSDAALRKLKAKRWKRLQRLNYLLAALTVVHAMLYGALWRPDSPYTVILIASVLVVAVAQAVGVRLWRRRRLVEVKA